MYFKDKIAMLIANELKLDKNDILDFIEVPQDPKMGDFAYPCFRHAKELKKSPAVIASDMYSSISKDFDKDFFEDIKQDNAYINFFINKQSQVKMTVEDIISKKSNYGFQNLGNEAAITIDMSSPNIAKPFHIGHLRSTVIGQALSNIFKKLNYKVYEINHLGDWGTQFGKLIVAFKKWGNKEEIEQGGTVALSKIYVKFHEEAEKDPTLDDEARAWFLEMEQGNEEALKLWKWMYDLSMVEFNKIYEILDIKMYANTGESFYNDKMDAVISELKEKKLLKKSQGAMVVDLEDYDMPPCLILRADGASLYATRDIATALYRKKTFDFVKSLYITGSEQELHFRQFFKVVELMGNDWAKNLRHIPFGLVSLEEGKMSTRQGRVVLMEDLLNEAIAKTKEIIEEKNPDLEDKDSVANAVGIGAVIFNDLSNNMIKDVVFSWDRILNFDGETGPFIQYSHARACSILKRFAKIDYSKDIDFSLIKDDYTFDLSKLLAEFPNKIFEASKKYEPSIISRYLIELSHQFNKFYDNNYIMNEDLELQKARLAIVFVSKIVLKEGLNILGIKAPEQI